MSEKLQLSEILGAFDLGGRDVWDELSESEKKQVSFYILNRMMSFSNGSREKQELAVLKTNEYSNKHFFEIGTSKQNDHRKLLWLLLCMSGSTNSIQYHKWTKLKKTGQSGDPQKIEFLRKIRPELGTQEVSLLAELTTKQELEELAYEYGLEPPKLRK